MSTCALERRGNHGGAWDVSVRKFNKTVHPFNFENLKSSDFERLVFAFLCRRWAWKALDWYGQLGADGGRDIIGVREDEWGRDEAVVVACANWQRLTAEKARSDLDKIVASKNPPNRVIIVAGGMVSADLKNKVASHAAMIHLRRVEVWSGPEFEEQLRAYAATVARRFFEGEELPDEPNAIRALVMDTPASEEEGLRLVARLFDRPAFQTHFRNESSLPAFSQALANTIEALNTGLWRTRDGALIGRVPSKNDFASPAVQSALKKAVAALVRLRSTFDEFQRQKLIVPCSCDQPDCPIFIIDPVAVDELNQQRLDLLTNLRRVVPDLVIDPSLHG